MTYSQNEQGFRTGKSDLGLSVINFVFSYSDNWRVWGCEVCWDLPPLNKNLLFSAWLTWVESHPHPGWALGLWRIGKPPKKVSWGWHQYQLCQVEWGILDLGIQQMGWMEIGNWSCVLGHFVRAVSHGRYGEHGDLRAGQGGRLSGGGF